MTRTRLRPVSPKRLAEADARWEVRQAVIRRDGERCRGEHLVPSVACGGPLDLDEVIPRGVRPGGHLEVDNVQFLCRRHHEWKHAFPEAAHAVGLRRWSHERPN